MRTLVLVVALLGLCAQAEAQSPKSRSGSRSGWSEEYPRSLRQAAARRRFEIQRHNHAQAEAQRLVSQGLGMLARPADPWNVPMQQPGYYSRSYYRPARRFGW
ncbi:MAG: hypothetical protein NVSMB9_23920 [Isosphaeraceae bacterium]